MSTIFSMDYDSFAGKRPLNEPEQGILQSLLEFREPQGLRRIFEILGGSVYACLGEYPRWLISSYVKGRGKTPLAELSIEPSEEWKRIAPSLSTRTYQGKKSALLMTHDVDYLSCYNSILEVAEMENKNGIRACYNFLVHAGYRIKKKALKDLSNLGHEVGLHGYAYDLRLAYRTPQIILRTLREAKKRLEDLLEKPVLGFRNHSLLLSRDMLWAVSQLGFLYDSGIYPCKNRNGLNSHFVWPFKYAKSSLHEIPVMWPQDADIFRRINLSDENALEFYQKRIEWVQNVQGTACLNFHPTIIGSRKKFYQKFLGWLKNQDMFHDTPSGFIHCIFKNSQGSNK